jgi:hypothetical protein
MDWIEKNIIMITYTKKILAKREKLCSSFSTQLSVKK